MDNDKERDKVIAKEYRLIPLEAASEESDWDINELKQQFWDYRKTIFSIIVLVGFIGLVIAITKPDTYEAKTTLLIEAGSQNTAESLLQNYGGLLGLSSNAMNQSGEIKAELYPDILNSMPFQLELIEQELHFASYDTTTSIFSFFSDIYEPSFYHYLKKYTVGLNSIEAQAFRSNHEKMDYNWQNRGVLDLPSSQIGIARGMADVMEITIDNNNKVTIEGWMPDPTATSQLVNSIKDLLSEYIIEHQTERVKRDMEFVEKQYQEAQEKFNNAQERLAEFKDQNVNLATARAQVQEQRLQSEYELAYNVYNSLAQRLEQSRIKVQEETPTFSTLEPILTPSSPSYPQRGLIVLSSLFLGAILGILLIGGVVVTKNFLFKSPVE